MVKLCIFVGTTLGGYGAWYLAECLGWDFFACFLVSSLGSIAGVYFGWKIGRRLA